MRRIAIVGAGGLVGSTMLQLTARSADTRVVPIVRSARSLPQLLPLGVEPLVTGGQERALEQSLTGVDAIVDVSVGTAREIVPAAQVLARAARRVGVERVIYTSSAAAQSVRRGHGRARPGTFYGQQKSTAEQVVLGLSDTGTRVTVIRPGLIWGERSPWTIRHIDALLRGSAIGPREATMTRPHVIYVRNLAATLLMLATSEDVCTGVCDVADDWWRSWEDYFRQLANALALSDRLVVAQRLHAGPAAALVIEWLTEHPRLADAARSLIERSPAYVGAIARASLKPTPRPWHIAPLAAAKARQVKSARVIQRDLDIYTRWAEPVDCVKMIERAAGAVTRTEALKATSAWAMAYGFVPMRAAVDG